jgi:hypothetical protein
MFQFLSDVKSTIKAYTSRIALSGFRRGVGGPTLAHYSDWPTSFCITALSGLVYLASLVARFRAR